MGLLDVLTDTVQIVYAAEKQAIRGGVELYFNITVDFLESFVWGCDYCYKSSVHILSFFLDGKSIEDFFAVLSLPSFPNKSKHGEAVNSRNCIVHVQIHISLDQRRYKKTDKEGW